MPPPRSRIPRAAGADGLTGIAAWLCGESDVPPARPLAAVGLGAYAYTALPDGHPVRSALRPVFLASVARHHRIRAELRPLFTAWAEAGIPFLVFKGFHLSEWVYPVRGTRFHGDVDVLVPPDRLAAARAVAERCGWYGAARPEGERGHHHQAPPLYGPRGEVMLEVHRWAVHGGGAGNRAPRRISAALWRDAIEVEWEGVKLRVPSAVDALLVGLVLQRCWSGDRWRLKPHDSVDLRLLRAQGASDAAVRARADALGCARTLRLFLARCDPPRALDLSVPAAAARRRWDRVAAREGAATPFARWWRRATGRPRRALWALAAVPAVLRARRALRGGPDLRRVLERSSPLGPARGSPGARARAVAGCLLATRVLRLNPDGDCALRSLAIYAALRRQGWPVVFVSGVAREGGALVGHAWVELDGRVLPELREPGNPARYTRGFVHPPPERG